MRRRLNFSIGVIHSQPAITKLFLKNSTFSVKKQHYYHIEDCNPCWWRLPQSFISFTL